MGAAAAGHFGGVYTYDTVTYPARVLARYCHQAHAVGLLCAMALHALWNASTVVGAEARKLLADGQAMLKKIIAGQWLTANAAFGIFPAASVNGGEDIEIYADEKRARVVMTWHNLRQQNAKPGGDRKSTRLNSSHRT